MKRVLLDAYFCQNLGDDLMVLELCEARPDDIFVAPDLNGAAGEALSAQHNLVQSNKSGWFAEAWHADSYVICGGSMFIDMKPTSLGDRLRFLKRWARRLFVAMIIRGKKGPFEAIGCNVGPIQSRWGVVLFGAVLRLATRVTVRDSPSESLVLRLTGQVPLKAPDMVLSYIARERRELQPSDSAAPVVGISVMEWPGLSLVATADQYLTFLKALRNQCPNAQVRLFGFQSAVVRDDVLASYILERADWANVTDCSYGGDVESIIENYTSCSHLLATRFHSGILALGLGIPMVQLVYSPKISNSLRELGWRGPQWVTESGLMSAHAPVILEALWSAHAVKLAPAAAKLHAAPSVKGE